MTSSRDDEPLARRGPLAAARWIIPAAVLFLSLLGAYAMWAAVVRTAEQERQSYFDFRVRDAHERIEQRMVEYQEVLLGTRGLFNASTTVQRSEFRRYVAALDLQGKFPGIQGVGFSVPVPSPDLAAHVASMRAEGFPDYAIRPPGARDLYTSIIYLEPFRDRNLRAFGYDMFSEPVRRRALERARDQGVTAVSGKVTLVQETDVGRQAGFLMYVPVYRSETPPPTLEERRAQFVGWAYAPFRTNDFMEGVLGEQAGDLDIEIYDGDDASPETRLYDSFDGAAATAREPLHAVQHLDIGGGGWLLAAAARPALAAHVGQRPTWGVGLTGVLAALMLAALTWLLTTSRARALTVADERGEEIRKLAQVQSTILANANVGISLVRDRKFVWTNRRMAEMVGHDADGLISQPTRQLFVSDEAFEAFGREAYPLLAKGAVYEVELEQVRAGGEHIWAHLRGKAVDPRDERGGSIWIFDDVTARRAADDELAARKSELEDLNAGLEARIARSVEEIRDKDRILIVQGRQAAMGEMIGNIAHQWRQPLNALGLVLANVVDAHRAGELDDATLDPLVGDAKRLIQKMSTTITDFRTFFRPDKEARSFSAREQVNAAIDLVRTSFTAQGITIVLDAPEDVALWGIPNEYSQVLLNLLVNAKEAIASGAGSGAIEIHLSKVGEQGCVRVRDTGGGIAPELLDRVFEPYFSTKPSGTGIGLHMSKTIIEKNMGGRITAANVPGGAEITVLAPCKKPE